AAGQDPVAEPQPNVVGGSRECRSMPWAPRLRTPSTSGRSAAIEGGWPVPITLSQTRIRSSETDRTSSRSAGIGDPATGGDLGRVDAAHRRGDRLGLSRLAFGELAR